MITRQVTLRKQVPSSDGLWLYRFENDINVYRIARYTWLGENDTEWEECNEKQKAEFEAHNKRVQEEQEKAMNEQQ